MDTLAQIASQFNDAIIQERRADGTRYYTLRDESPDWMLAAVRVAHDSGDMLPNGTSYSMIDDVASVLAGTSPREWDDVRADEISALVDTIGDETEWLASHTRRVSFVEDAVAEYGMPSARSFDMRDVIQRGIRAEYEMIWDALVSAFRAQESK